MNTSFLALVALVPACASAPPKPAATVPTAASVASTCDVTRDRAAIRGMAGSFLVTFTFDETEVLTEGYQRRPRSRTSAREVVHVIEDSEKKMSLQHILLVREKGHVEAMKHWRQDWVFEDTTLLEFEGHETFARRELSPSDISCAWSQAVFEVSDAPRYESVGRWVHAGDTSTWSSAPTWRPLPRREYTKRHDYDVLIGQNRHVVRPDGWVHEQNTEKRVLANDRSLVREVGENRYVRSSYDDAELANAYLRETSPFWAGVREEWQTTFIAKPRFKLVDKVDSKLLYEVLFPLADQTRTAAVPDARKRVRDTLDRYVVDAPLKVAQR